MAQGPTLMAFYLQRAAGALTAFPRLLESVSAGNKFNAAKNKDGKIVGLPLIVPLVMHYAKHHYHPLQQPNATRAVAIYDNQFAHTQFTHFKARIDFFNEKTLNLLKEHASKQPATFVTSMVTTPDENYLEFCLKAVPDQENRNLMRAALLGTRMKYHTAEPNDQRPILIAAVSAWKVINNEDLTYEQKVRELQRLPELAIQLNIIYPCKLLTI